MNLQMVDLRGQYLRLKPELDEVLSKVLNSGQFVRGPEVAQFERELADYIGTSHAIGVANGTDALQIAYMAIGIGPGDEVITPAFTFIATAEAAAILGATPVFADIEAESFNLNPECIEPLITPRTKAIVPVHLFGQAANMSAILDIGERYGIPIIEDNAQAIGASVGGRKTGSLGHLATCSFFPSKNLGCYGDGGAVLTEDPELADRVRMITNHGGRHKYYNEIVGMNSRLDALQAAILRVKLNHLDHFTEARRRSAQRYEQWFAGHTEIRMPAEVEWGRHVFHQYTIRVRSRDELAVHLKSQNVPFGIYYPVPLHQLPVFATNSRCGPLPVTERTCREVISLPMHTELTTEQVTRVSEAVLEFTSQLNDE